MLGPMEPRPRTQILHGRRIGAQAKIATGCAAVIFDDSRTKILLTRRSDNDEWCLPSGGVEPGESVAETCAREVREETGLEVDIVKLLGVYSSPDWLVQYPDGNRVQVISLCFEAVVTGGSLTVSSETTAFGYFAQHECEALLLLANHRERIRDAFCQSDAPVIRS
jgi:ADP-ribose pyrophosphatase YjhB (NUDIX family)